MKNILDYGCDIDIRDEHGKTAEEIAASKGFTEIVELITNKRMESLSLNQNNSSENPNECKICFEQKEESFVFLPCGHTVACEQCCRRILGEPCPICRQVVNQYNRIYL